MNPARTRIKICGITRVDDALQAAWLGADAIGLVFYHRSPRRVRVEQAASIVDALPPFISVVALFVDAGQEEIKQVLSVVRVDYLQFHGDESPAACRAYRQPYIKAVRMRPGQNVAAYAARYDDAAALLLDTYSPGLPGGTGEPFDWSTIPQSLSRPLILAGGLHAGNVADAVAAVHPYAVDVSGGVESGKGIKDAAKMTGFIQQVWAMQGCV